ncbi:MAG TPA: isoaspartyl peptidase/L-asparaginase [Thermodesulfobacteriota bacterium]
MVILVHGGAGSKRPQKKALKGLKTALEAGFSVLKEGGGSLEAVLKAIVIMEDSGLYNAGSGANLQLDGRMRLDASIMEGVGMRAGAVIGLEGYSNPILAARIAMELPNNVFTNIGAARLARRAGLKRLGEPSERALTRLKKALRDTQARALYEEYFSTVGAVAIDGNGNVAAGSSTGGVLAMLPGRVGDTPLIGSGVYAELGAVSCTGRGEDILRLCLAKEACMGMEETGARRAALAALRRMKKFGGQAGLLAIDKKGGIAICHTTEFMPAGAASKKGVRVEEAWRRV